MSDGKGDTVAYPKAVLGLPFKDQGNSYLFNDDYEMQCSSASQKSTGGGKVSGPSCAHVAAGSIATMPERCSTGHCLQSYGNLISQSDVLIQFQSLLHPQDFTERLSKLHNFTTQP